MLISRNWLQSYCTTELPSAQEIADTLLLHSFEIEDVYETVDGDSVIDIDVLPNRAHDCLSHYGIAKEYHGLSAQVLDIHQHKKNILDTVATRKNSELPANVPLPEVTVSASACHRYFTCIISGVTVGDSPSWLQDYLRSVDRRIINNVVDVTNYLMFDLGQPLHVFDADKIVGGMYVRNAKTGETLTLLGGDEVLLTENDLVIADQEGVLALAGIKGGVKAEVTSSTKNILLEIGNFQSDNVRASSRRLKIQTDSSKRFENKISAALVDEVRDFAIQLLASIADGNIGSSFDYYPEQQEPEKIAVHLSDINRILGTVLTSNKVSEIFDTFSFSYTLENNVFIVTPPYLRLDIKIVQDVIEEIGRFHGYQNIPSRPISEIQSTFSVNTILKITHQIRNYLVEQAYRELYTYSFVADGDVVVANPIASDKPALRTNLLNPGISKARELNSKNASFLGLDRIQVFEIGRIYSKGEEKLSLVVSCENVNKKARKTFGDEASQLSEIEVALDSMISSVAHVKKNHGTALEYVFDYYDEKLSLNESYENVFDATSYKQDARYHSLSLYPYSVRDISLWVDEGVTAWEVMELIKYSAGALLQRCYLFDEFSKEGRTSYAFSVVIQSFEKTLNDSDIDGLMESITKAINAKGWEVR